MKQFENQELTDQELNEMLSTWSIKVPSEDLRARIFARKQTVAPYRSSFAVLSDIEPIWETYAGGRSRSFGAALLLQACVLAFLFITVHASLVQRVVKPAGAIFLAPYQPKPSVAANKGGGGGGGQQAATPVSRGEAPKFARKAFIPPAVAVPKPLLPVVPTISAPAPQIDASIYGDPLSKVSDPSAGQGVDGLGDGKGGGLGPGNGGGRGPGYSDGIGGTGAYRIGGDVLPPVLISKVEPEYSEQARKAKYSGSVLLSVIVDERGIPRNIQVVRTLGLGLDQKAIEAVQRWRFRPGTRNGKAVPVVAAVEVSFRLL
jgi:periplasmic protein TonB